MYKLILLTIIIQIVDTLAYSVRLNAVKSGKYALSISFFNIFILLSRTANMFQAPLIGTIVGKSIITHHNPIHEIRLVILASTFGTVFGIILIPTFLKLFAAGVNRLEAKGSVYTLVIESLKVKNVKKVVKNTTRPRKRMILHARFREIPKRLLLLHTLITAISSIGVLSAFYATYFVSEEFRLATSASSGMINGIATILLTILVDPQSAIITDQAMNGRRPYEDVKALVILLLATKLLGTLLAQAFIVPAALIIAQMYH